MSDKFPEFAALVHARYELLAKNELFVVGDAADDIFGYYLMFFPEGTNPVFRERTEHDCTCCKQFVRNIGNTVALINGQIETIWAVEGAPEPYATVAAQMDAFVKQLPIKGVFRTKERQYGNKSTVSLIDGKTTMRWNHFEGRVQTAHFSPTPETVRGEKATAAQVFKRGMDELQGSALDTVLDLIAGNAIYRGAEFKNAVQQFKDMHDVYRKLNSDTSRQIFIWENVGSFAARFRNTVIGTLVQDLSEGVPLEKAVRSYETKVAPTNYKRPTALITPNMVKDAVKTINELGLEPALQRRFAKISDVSVNNVLWVANNTVTKMKDGIASMLMDVAVAPKPKVDKAIDVTIDTFMETVIPKASSMELYVGNRLVPNFMSLTAPATEDSKSLFKWDNDFAWSYDGNITDSVKEKVKRAGGNVTAPFRVSLAWYNTDDLDLHITEPSGNRICFHNRGNPREGNLDVDMNAFSGIVRDAVENICWPRNAIKDGIYKVEVNNYRQRETNDVGFLIEVESNGMVQQFTYASAVKGTVLSMEITMKDGAIQKIRSPKMVEGSASNEKWGINTEQFVKVSTVMKSPNHWDENSVGNEHWFFMLEGCVNPDETRGIYNEFLNPALDKHRKVFEILGDKTKCPVTPEQLSGVGFSSTRQDEVVVLVKGPKLQATYNVKF